MLSIDWRAPAAYGHAKAIPPAGFAWEYLRRHEDYHRDFQTISQVKGKRCQNPTFLPWS